MVHFYMMYKNMIFGSQSKNQCFNSINRFNEKLKKLQEFSKQKDDSLFCK